MMEKKPCGNSDCDWWNVGARPDLTNCMQRSWLSLKECTKYKPEVKVEKKYSLEEFENAYIKAVKHSAHYDENHLSNIRKILTVPDPMDNPVFKKISGRLHGQFSNMSKLEQMKDLAQACQGIVELPEKMSEKDVHWLDGLSSDACVIEGVINDYLKWVRDGRPNR